MTDLLVGTADGVRTIGGGQDLEGRDVVALASDRWGLWALADGRSVWRRTTGPWVEVAPVEDLSGRCLSATDDGLLMGTSEARLFRLEDGVLQAVGGFDRVEGRDGWYTPWGGPPDTRSLSRGVDGTVYANVHVGGIVRSADGGRWEPTIDVDTDVHEVLAHPTDPAGVLAACAYGFARSDDGGRTWAIDDDELHGSYCRAVAVAGDTLLVTASTGPFTERAAVYRRPLESERPFARCTAGLPEWFPSNIDTGCLAAEGPRAAFGTDEGAVYLSEDQGETWERVGQGLGRVRCLLFA